MGMVYEDRELAEELEAKFGIAKLRKLAHEAGRYDLDYEDEYEVFLALVRRNPTYLR